MTHQLSDDAQAAKQRQLGRLWLQQLASLMHDHGFKIARTYLRPQGTVILMRSDTPITLALATYNDGVSWSAWGARGIVELGGNSGTRGKVTGGTTRLTLEGLEAAQRRVFDRCIKPLR